MLHPRVSVALLTPRENSADTEWHPWNGQALKADWETMTGVELYDYHTVDMTDFDQFDRVNVAGVEHKDVQAELSAALRANYDKM